MAASSSRPCGVFRRRASSSGWLAILTSMPAASSSAARGSRPVVSRSSSGDTRHRPLAVLLPHGRLGLLRGHPQRRGDKGVRRRTASVRRRISTASLDPGAGSAVRAGRRRARSRGAGRLQLVGQPVGLAADLVALLLDLRQGLLEGRDLLPQLLALASAAPRSSASAISFRAAAPRRLLGATASASAAARRSSRSRATSARAAVSFSSSSARRPASTGSSGGGSATTAAARPAGARADGRRRREADRPAAAARRRSPRPARPGRRGAGATPARRAERPRRPGCGGAGIRDTAQHEDARFPLARPGHEAVLAHPHARHLVPGTHEGGAGQVLGQLLDQLADRGARLPGGRIRRRARAAASSRSRPPGPGPRPAWPTAPPTRRRVSRNRATKPSRVRSAARSSTACATSSRERGARRSAARSLTVRRIPSALTSRSSMGRSRRLLPAAVVRRGAAPA